MTTMHHFMIDADPATGSWDFGTINYLGEIESADFYAKKDTDAVHYDHHDGEALDAKFWDIAGLQPTKSNVALTIVWKS